MPTKILFILCGDFGELLIADYFVDGQPLQALALCPDKIIATYDKTNLETRGYRNIQDIIQCLNTFRPELVVLASGYLLTLHNLLSLSEIGHLIQHVRAQGVALATTDPWMRCWEEYREQLPEAQRENMLHHPFQQQQAKLEELLQDIPHIYGVPFTTHRVPSVAFFNPHAFAGYQHNGHGKFNRWLFILSSIDFGSIMQREGGRFVDHLTNRFADILQQPSSSIVFICPPACVDAIKSRLGNTSRVTLVPFCKFSEFQSHIFSCDIGVYWNYLSASIIYHLHKGSAMLFAGRGHMLTACPPLKHNVEKSVLNNVVPTVFDLSQPVSDRLLQDAKCILDQMNTLILPEYSKQQSPHNIVKSLIDTSDSHP